GNSASNSGGALYNSGGTQSGNNYIGTIYLLNSIVVGNTATASGNDVFTADTNATTNAWYSLAGSVYNTSAFKGDNSNNNSGNVAVDDVFANVEAGKAVSSTKTVSGITQTYFALKHDGAAAKTGVFTWHNANYTAVA
ncbi:MAG: hypothetical protein PHQ75_07305, partial [Thermoguttaceae bacterium]|nr:hypothetical protein [Thermoguttaceae bacterium]